MIKFEHKDLKDLTFIDLFAGIGGFRLALESLGAKCVYSNEIDKNARKTYIDNFGEITSSDIKQVDSNEVPLHDILCAGFPCQPFSISGKQKGFDDDRGTLFFDILRIVKAKQPKVIFLENVKNLLSHNNGSTFMYIKKSLEDLNYDVYYKVLNSSNYGIPQSRERLYIVCFKKEMQKSCFKFPSPIELNTTVSDLLINDDNLLSGLYFDKSKLSINYNNNCTKSSKDKPLRIGIVNKGGQGERVYDANGVGITLSATGGGVFARTGGYLINGKVRKLHPRECARLMGFPEEFKLSNNKNISYKQLGNSVVVNVLQLIAVEIGKSIC